MAEKAKSKSTKRDLFPMHDGVYDDEEAAKHYEKEENRSIEGKEPVAKGPSKPRKKPAEPKEDRKPAPGVAYTRGPGGSLVQINPPRS